jgi:hypothetical protein
MVEFIPIIAASALAWVLMGRSLIALATVLTFLPFIGLDMDSVGVEGIQGAVSTGSAFKVICRASGAVLFGFLALTNSRVMQDLVRIPSLIPQGFVLWSLLGLTNSANPSLSILRIAEWFVFYLGAVVIHNKVTRPCGDRALSRFMILGFSPLVVTVLSLSVFNPDLSVETRAMDQLTRLGGMSMDPNSIGLLGVLLGVVGLTLWRARREDPGLPHRLFALFAVGIGLYLIVASRSRSALFGFLMALSALGFIAIKESLRSRLRVFAVLLVAAVVASFTLGDLVGWLARGEELSSLRTATGRSELWIGLLSSSFSVHPILGHGYMMLSETGHFVQRGIWWNNAHNAYIFALVSTGVVGFSLILGMVWLGVRGWWRLAYSNGDGVVIIRRGMAACYLVLLVDASANYGMVGHPSPSMFLFHIFYARAVLRS